MTKKLTDIIEILKTNVQSIFRLEKKMKMKHECITIKRNPTPIKVKTELMNLQDLSRIFIYFR